MIPFQRGPAAELSRRPGEDARAWAARVAQDPRAIAAGVGLQYAAEPAQRGPSLKTVKRLAKSLKQLAKVRASLGSEGACVLYEDVGETSVDAKLDKIITMLESLVRAWTGSPSGSASGAPVVQP